MSSESMSWGKWFDTKDAGKLRTNLINALSSEDFNFILHPLGFYCSILDTLENSKIRLHYWRKQQREIFTAVTPFHDHVWKLRSHILVGEIENVIFTLESDIDGEYQLADIRQYDGVDEIVPKPERVNLKALEKRIYKVGEFYEIQPRIFHCSNVSPDIATITLVHSEVMVKDGPRTLVPVGFKGQDPLREPIRTAREIQDEIIGLLTSNNIQNAKHETTGS